MTAPGLRIAYAEEADRAVAVPRYETAGSAGADLRANLPEAQRVAGLILPPGGRCLVPTGLRLAVPVGFEVQVRPRSGLALKHGITIPNSPGTIDSDYRGPLGVILLNTGTEPFAIAHGDRIAQMIVAPVVRAALDVVADLDGTVRGGGGFGSTGAG